MGWDNFYRLKIMRQGKDGLHPYFFSELKVPTEFAMIELQLREFLHLSLSNQELAHLSLDHRKILLRLKHFQSREFLRITENFFRRLQCEKEQELHFSTTGGGIYLFLALERYQNELKHKKIFCQTTEIPLALGKWTPCERLKLQLHYRPLTTSFFDAFPSLWQNSPFLPLFEVDQENDRAA